MMKLDEACGALNVLDAFSLSIRGKTVWSRYMQQDIRKTESRLCGLGKFAAEPNAATLPAGSSFGLMKFNRLRH